MMSMAGVVYGAMIGGGAFLVVRELLPSRPDLGSVLDRLETTYRGPEGAVCAGGFPQRDLDRAGRHTRPGVLR